MDIKLKIAVRQAGGVRALARKLGVTPAAIRQWDRVPYVWLLQVEKVTGIPRDRLRPELFREYKRTTDVRELEPA